MTKLIITAAAIFILLLAGDSFSQSLKGKIIDESTSDPLVGTTVKVIGTKSGTVSDLDGNYIIDNLNPGIYDVEFSYIGFNTKLIKGVKILQNEVTKLDVSMEIDGLSTEEITVESNTSLANEQSILTEQKNSSKIQDGISEQQIKRAPDASASDVLKRIMGVNIVDNKFVYVRGTSERYNNTTLNGVLLPSTEADKRSFSFDLFPSRLLENIIVAKSFTPDLPANFSGGLVQMNTKNFVDGFTFGLETAGSYFEGTTSKGNFYNYNAGQEKILFFNSGLDNGDRSIPENFPGSKFSTANNYGKSLINNWGQNDRKAPANGGFQMSLGNNFKVFDNPLGVLFSYTYLNAFKNENIKRAEYNSDTTGLISYEGRSSNYTVLNGGIFNLNYKLGDNNKLSLKNTYSINSDDRTQYYEGFTRTTDYFDKHLYGTDFTERTLLSSQISGSHYVPGLKSLNITWIASYSESDRNEPDTKTTFYQREEGSDDPFIAPLTTIANSNLGQRFYSEMKDINRNAGINFENNFFKIDGKQTSKIKYGLLAVGTDRNFQARVFAPKLAVFSSSIGLQPIEKIFSPENFDSTKMYMVETTDKSDSYSAVENTYAGYLMVDIPVKKLRVTTGMRYEYNEQKLEGYERTTGKEVNVNQRNNDYLPSLNLTYALNTNTNFRASFSNTVSRPELREIAPFGYVDFVTGGELSGNPELQECIIQNYDLRYEMFPAAGEIFSVSLFYKHFNKPIEKVIVPTLVNSTIPSYTFENAYNGAKNYGVEFEVRKKLEFISKYLRDFTLNGNLSLINSKVNLEGTQNASGKTERQLQGQSPYTLNLGLFYDNYELGLNVNVLYNKFGDKISEVARAGFSDVYEKGRDILDFSVTKSFLKKFEGKFSVKDIFNQDEIYTEEFSINGNEKVEKTVRRINSGTSFNLTLSYKY